MILKYFLPGQEFSWTKLDSMSAKLPGKATWPQQMLIQLHDMGFDVCCIEGFDGRAFIKEGGIYLRRAFGDEVATWQITHGDIPREQKFYQAAYDVGVHIEKRVPSFSDVIELLQEGYLLNCVVNSLRLNGRLGYIGHSVLVYQADDHGVTMHDPGLPPHQARRVKRHDFIAAWADPNDDAKSIIAVGPGKGNR